MVLVGTSKQTGQANAGLTFSRDPLAGLAITTRGHRSWSAKTVTYEYMQTLNRQKRGSQCGVSHREAG